MRLIKLQNYLKEHDYPFEYSENDDCGGIEMIIRGLRYHIWEYPEPERGAATNIRHAGRMEDLEGDYEEQIIAEMESW